MTAITFIVTNAGLALLPSYGGVAPVTLSHYGISQTAFAASAAATAIPNERKRLATLSGAPTGTGTITLSLMDDSTDVYDMRSVGIYASDGTLFAVYSQATPITSKASGSYTMTTVDVAFARVNVTELIFGDANFLLPSATTEREGLVELATSGETNIGTDTTRAVTPKAMRDTLTSAYVIARIGYTPLNQTAYTATDVRNKLVTVDGAGSGVDADLLDGHQGAEFALRMDVLSGIALPARLRNAALDIADWDTATENGFYTSNSGLNAPAPGYAYGAVTSRSGVHCTQDIFFIDATAADTKHWRRHRQGGTWGAWYLVKDSQPELDTRYVLKSAYTAFDVHSKLLAVDGAGSGVDADLLDGQHGSYYAPRASPVFSGTLSTQRVDINNGSNQTLLRLVSTGETPSAVSSIFFDRGGLTRWSLHHGQSGNLLLLRDVGGSLASMPLSVDAATGVVSFGFRPIFAGNIPWDAANDGAGSGLDADLLDGRQGSEYALITDTLSGAALPARLRSAALDIADWDMATDNGFYTAYNGLNAPAAGYAYGVVTSRSGVHCTQDIFFNDATAADTKHWRRHRQGGTWGAWYRVTDSQPELDARYVQTTAYNATDVRNKLITVDGSGSGVDADLLDGQHGSYYAPRASPVFSGTLSTQRVDINNGSNQALLRLISTGETPSAVSSIYFDRGGLTRWSLHHGQGGDLSLLRDVSGSLASTPLSVSAATGAVSFGVRPIFAGNIPWDAANDGAGSGLDAGLLAGNAPSYYTDITARLGYTPLNQTAYTATDIRNKLITVDGSGSGVDADLWRGQSPEDMFGTFQKTASGWAPLFGNMIIQWTRVLVGQSGGTQAVDWPRAFPNACLSAFCCQGNRATGSLERSGCSVWDWTKDGAQVGNNANFQSYINVWAIGH